MAAAAGTGAGTEAGAVVVAVVALPSFDQDKAKRTHRAKREETKMYFQPAAKERQARKGEKNGTPREATDKHILFELYTNSFQKRYGNKFCEGIPIGAAPPIKGTHHAKRWGSKRPRKTKTIHRAKRGDLFCLPTCRRGAQAQERRNNNTPREERGNELSIA